MRPLLILIIVWLTATLVCCLLARHADAAACSFRCKVRFSACRIDQPKDCVERELLPDKDAGLCAYQAMFVVQDWINKRFEADHVRWRQTTIECVTPDDSKV